MQVKICTKCGEMKPVGDFYKAKSRHGKVGLRADCKDCVRAKSAKWTADNPDVKAAYNAKYRIEHADALREYIKDWRKNNPEKQKIASKNWYEENKEKAIAASAEWISKNPKKHKRSMANWYQSNKEATKANNDKWKRENPDKMREYANRSASKRAEDPKYRLECAVKQGVRRGLLSGSKAGRRTFEVLGYSPDDLRRHLEKRFQPGMTWDNYGEWHIDHEIPLSAFNYQTPDDIDFKRAWALSNLQPLWAFDNLSKKDKLEKPFQPSLLLATNDNGKTPQKETA
ncbi:HNH endonuclease [Sinorhizobium medicae]|nr:HNH endonuclease [Sinorhizobium medicae]